MGRARSPLSARRPPATTLRAPQGVRPGRVSWNRSSRPGIPTRMRSHQDQDVARAQERPQGVNRQPKSTKANYRRPDI